MSTVVLSAANLVAKKIGMEQTIEAITVSGLMASGAEKVYAVLTRCKVRVFILRKKAGRDGKGCKSHLC